MAVIALHPLAEILLFEVTLRARLFPRLLRRLAAPVLLIFAFAWSVVVPAGAAAAAGAPTTVSAVTPAKAGSHIAKSPSSESADFDGCIFCKSRTCSGLETLLKIQHLDPIVPAALPEPEERTQGTLPRPPPGPAAPLPAFPNSFDARGPPSLG